MKDGKGWMIWFNWNAWLLKYEYTLMAIVSKNETYLMCMKKVKGFLNKSKCYWNYISLVVLQFSTILWWTITVLVIVSLPS